MKQVHTWSVLTAFNPQGFAWDSGITYKFFSAEPRVLFISAGNCFHFRWSHCFLRHEQTDWAESIQNYFLSLKIGSVWVALGCLRTFPTLYPAWSCTLPNSVGFSVALEHVPWIMQREGGDLLPGIIARTGLAKILQTEKVPVTSQRSISKISALKSFNINSVQKQWYWTPRIK